MPNYEPSHEPERIHQSAEPTQHRSVLLEAAIGALQAVCFFTETGCQQLLLVDVCCLGLGHVVSMHDIASMH